MNYIQGTIVLPLTLSIDKPANIKWYIDAEFAVHKDMKSQTCGFVTMGTEGAYVQYRKQKLNTNTSTGSNPVGVDDALTQVILTRYLLKNQGYEINGNVIYKDNQSAFKLENSGIQ